MSLFFSCDNIETKRTIVTEAIKTTHDRKKINPTHTLNITKTFVLGKFDYRSDSTFIKVNPKYTTKEIYLNIEVVNAFTDMYKAAKNDSIELKIISGTRNFYEQKNIWERKWKKYKSLNPFDRAKKILEYSSMPSTSRHHWGTDIDLNSLNNSYFHSGKGLKEYNWLLANANHFGFYQVYTEKDSDRTGYNLEKWHWSYLPLASQYLEFYNKKIINNDINSFLGSEQAPKLRVINDYVNGISQKAKDYN